jgi:hypothetical protein
MIIAMVVVALVAGQAVPAGSQSTPPYELREGLWVGESIAWAELGGSAEGATATFDGVITTEFIMFVDENGTVDGDWILDGDAVMLMMGSVNGDIVFDYTGEGALTGDKEKIDMNGGVDTLARATIGGRSVTYNGTQTFALPIQLTSADCYTLDGDWVFPLDTLAQDAEWTSRNIDGWFYAAYLGDAPDEALVAEINQLWDDQNAWSDTALATGNIDLGEVAVLLTRAQTLANRLAEADECLYEQTVHPDDFVTLFSITLTQGLLFVTATVELDAVNVHSAAIALNMIGGSGLHESVSRAIQTQAQRIIGENMASDGDTCDPCMASGDTASVVSAALAGFELGHTFEVGGMTYTPERIVQAVGVYEAASGS